MRIREMTSFARELKRIGACDGAVAWVNEQEKMFQRDPNEMWAVCERNDWMRWIIWFAFNIGKREEMPARMHYALVTTFGRMFDTPEKYKKSYADKIREYFPEWPL